MIFFAEAKAVSGVLWSGGTSLDILAIKVNVNLVESTYESVIK